MPAKATNAAVVINWKYDEQGDATACLGPSRPGVSGSAWPASVSVSILRLATDDKGLAVDFSAKRAGGEFHGHRTGDGIPFLNSGAAGEDPEDRLAFVLRPVDVSDGAQPFVVYLNPNGNCVVDSPNAVRLDRAACHGVVRSVNDKNAGGKDDELASTCPKRNTKDDSLFCGRIVATWALLKERLRVGALADVRVQDVVVCALLLDRDLSPAEIASSACAGMPATQLAHADRDKFRGGVQAEAGRETSNGANASASASTSTSGRRRAAAVGAPTASPAPSPTSGTLFGGTAVVPIHHVARLSATADKLNVGSLFDRLQQNLSAASPAFGLPSFSDAAKSLLNGANTGCDGKCPDDSFKKIDVDLFNVLPSPLRTGVDTKFADYQIDLKPVDFTAIPTVNYGGKLVYAPLDTHAGLAWYRDIADWASGSVVHLDHDFGPVTLGITHSVANIDRSKVTNPYQVDLDHTANTVVGGVIRFLPDESLQLFGRYGFLAGNTGARDMLGVITYSPAQPPRQGLTKEGSYWKPSAGVGYRIVDANYDPLGTSYDEFTGTKSIFGTVHYQRVAAGPSGPNPLIDLSLTAVRAWDDVQARYNAVTASASAKFGAGTSSPVVSYTRTRSNIAASVFAKQAASVKVTDADEGRNLVRNDSDAVSVKIQSGIFTVSTGPTWTDAPKKCDPNGKPLKCPAVYTAMQQSYSLSADQPAFALAVKAGLAPVTQAAFGQKAVASNQLDVKAAGSYSNWCLPGLRIQPSATYDTNVSEDQSSYVPGKLFESRLDIGTPAIPFVLRFNYKIVNDQSNPVVPARSRSGNSFFVGVAMDSASAKFRTRCASIRPS